MSEPDTPTSAPSADTGRAGSDVPAAGSIVVIGAGPAGLTAAQELAKAGVTSTVLEADDMVGGISRTVQRDKWRFDIGGHRFFTKVKRVDDFWHEILDEDDFMLRPRSSRIYYQGKFYDYPIKLGNALRNLGPIEAFRCGLSFLWVRVRPPKDQSTLEGYIVTNYGWRLYGHFFKSYTEKLWAMPPSKIGADWGAQRIKGMSLWSAVWEPLRARFAGSRKGAKQVTSLIEQFQYPKYGPGMMWERCREKVEAAGTKVIMETPVTKIRHEGGRATAVVAESGGVTTEYPADHVISSMPFSQLLQAMDPPVPAEVQAAADDLAFRDFLSIALVVPADKVPWTDNWIYIHAPEVKTMRVQNFGSWSPYMVSEGHNVLGLEYTVTEGDEWWTAPDEQLIETGKKELEQLGSGQRRRRLGRLRGAHAQGLSGLRRGLPAQRRHPAHLAGREHAERAPGGAQRHAPLQQPGPLDVHGHAHGREHRRRGRPRHLVGQRRGGVPRGGLRLGAGHHGRHGAPRHRPRCPDPAQAGLTRPAGSSALTLAGADSSALTPGGRRVRCPPRWASVPAPRCPLRRRRRRWTSARSAQPGGPTARPPRPRRTRPASGRSAS